MGTVLDVVVNVGPVSNWDVNEPLRTTSTLSVATVSASTEKQFDVNILKRLTSSMRPHKIITL